jgi:succinate dehydrogenase/fumarate reductase flavoprotein subunit
MKTIELEYDLVIVGGGTGGPMAAVKAKEKNPKLRVLVLEKANVKRSGAISMGMDGLNNAVIPGHATPEQYTKEITVANDGIVDQKGVFAYASNSFAMIEELDRWGVKFEKDETGDFAVRKVHHLGSYVLPMPEGHHMKKVLYRQLKRARVDITNRVVATRLITGVAGEIAGVMGFDCRTADFYVIKAKSVVLCTGAAGRLGLPASGYMFGTYENPTNSGEGHVMAYHAGAELTNLECFQVNPLIKDYNGPACAYVTGPFGGFTANSQGSRFIECDYWSGQMMLEFFNELEGGRGPVFLKLDHLAEETIAEIEEILHTNERPSRGRFHEGRGTDYRRKAIEMHISEIGFCSGHSASGIWTNEKGECSIPGLYAAGDCASIPHNYMLGAFVYGKFCGENAADYVSGMSEPVINTDMIEAERKRIMAPLSRPDGLTPFQVEYKTRRIVNDYLQPPKVTRKMEIALERFGEIKDDLNEMGAENPHELMRAMEAHTIRDCAELAASASLYRKESRWGLYHLCVDHPEKDDENWFCHTNVTSTPEGKMVFRKREIEPYIIELNDEEKSAYQRLRVAGGKNAN